MNIEQAVEHDHPFRWRLVTSQVLLDVTRMVKHLIENQEDLVAKLREQNELIKQQNAEINARNEKLDALLDQYQQAEEDDSWWREGRQPPGHDLEDK